MALRYERHRAPGYRESGLQVSDAELVERLKGGDKAAFRELARRYADRLFALAYSLLGSAADAEDLVQETMLAALNGISSFEGRSSLGTWLRSILTFQASKLRRSKRVRNAAPLPEDVASPLASDAALRDESSVPATEARMDVMAMLDTLPHDYREALVLRELQQMSYEEIAQVLGVPLGTVESRLYRARQTLRQKFKAYTP